MLPKMEPVDASEKQLLPLERLSGKPLGGKLAWQGSEIKVCDLCGCDMRVRRFMIDGRLNGPGGGAANMCSKCYWAHGVGIKWGTGQLYTQMEDGTWLMTAGFPPGHGNKDV
jgi:hypothetical protein